MLAGIASGAGSRRVPDKEREFPTATTLNADHPGIQSIVPHPLLWVDGPSEPESRDPLICPEAVAGGLGVKPDLY